MDKSDPSQKKKIYNLSLCLSGGGFRASLFHVGALKRLNELGILSQIEYFSSVSGGSIANGLLATRWDRLKKGADGVFQNFDDIVSNPIIAFCKEDLRTSVAIWQRANPLNWGNLIKRDYSVTDLLAKSYAQSLFDDTPLSGITKKTDFVFCATNMETGANWEFEREEMGDYRTGKTKAPCSVAKAVAASSAFPVVFPPLILKFPGRKSFKGGADQDLSDSSYHQIPLTDGGVYDNLGLEPAWKRSKIVISSDAGQPFRFEDDPKMDIFGRMSRSFDIMLNQGPVLRRRLLMKLFKLNELAGTYWGITTKWKNYELDSKKCDVHGYDDEIVQLISSIRTDLDPFTDGEIGCLINHGYSLADCGIKRHVTQLYPVRNPKFVWPYPAFANAESARSALKHSSERGILKDIWNSIVDAI